MSDLSKIPVTVITGFLGGLTTFSTFSSEVTQLLLRGEYTAGIALAVFAFFVPSLLLAGALARRRSSGPTAT